MERYILKSLEQPALFWRSVEITDISNRLWNVAKHSGTVRDSVTNVRIFIEKPFVNELFSVR